MIVGLCYQPCLTLSSFVLFSFSGIQVPLGLDCFVPDGDSTTDDHRYGVHCCTLSPTREQFAVF